MYGLNKRVLKVEVIGKKEVLYRQLSMIVNGLGLLMICNKRKINLSALRIDQKFSSADPVDINDMDLYILFIQPVFVSS